MALLHGRCIPAAIARPALSAPRPERRRAIRCRAGIDTKQVLQRLVEGKNLSLVETRQALDTILDADSPEQISAFLVLLAAKGETADEIAGLATAMRERATLVHTPHKVVDIVGTGGDGIGSVNISTGACVLAAAAGAKVAKHGNRSVSSLCGSADVLEEMGIMLDLGPEGAAACIEQAGITFMFAPRFHPAMKAVVPVRRALKIRTAFNILGPMLNPAGADYGLVGVYSPELGLLMAEALQKLGMKKALVVNSMGLDELTPMGPADIVEVTPDSLRRYSLDPLTLGIPRCEVADLAGGDAKLNAQILMDVFGGQRGAVADALALNAGYALAACDFAATPQEGIQMAQEAQRSGKAADTLRAWAAASQAEYQREQGKL